MSNENNIINNSNKEKFYNKNKNTKEKESETGNDNNINDINPDKDNNSVNALNYSNELENDIKRTLISPDISPDEIKILDNNKKFDDDSNNIIIPSEGDKINYNPNPFISPTMMKKNYKTISKMDKIIIDYNKVKTNFNKILSFNQEQKTNNKEKYLNKLSDYNISMLNHLSDLSSLLNKIVDNQKIYTNKNLLYSSADIKPKGKIIFTNVYPGTGLENAEKMLNLYEKQYNKIIERLETVKNKEYVNELKTKINNINKEIAIYEQENRNLHKTQLIQENLLSNGKSPELLENNLKKKIEMCDKFQNEYIKTSKKIENDKEYIKTNEQKINILNEKCNNLAQLAKDMYDIEIFEDVEKIKKRSKEKKIKMERKAREYEVNIHSIKSNYNKLKKELEQNKKELEFLENEKNLLIEKYKNKQFELVLCNNKLKDYQNMDINFNTNGDNVENGKIDNDNNINNPKKRKINIKLESLNTKNILTNKTNENKKIKIDNNILNSNNEVLNNNIKNINNKGILLSSSPSLISLTKEKSNFGDINDMQLLIATSNTKGESNNINTGNTNINSIENENKEKLINNEQKNNNINEIKKEVINFNIISEPNNKNHQEIAIKENINSDKLDTEKNKGKIINTLSKEMILKGLDEQEKENKTLIYSSRVIKDKGNKGALDRRNFLKLNFSFVSSKIDNNNKLNKSLNTLPNERNFLNDEIEEDIITDNSADNKNMKESKVKKFPTEENEKVKNLYINKDNKLNINNNSIEIDKNLISDYKNNNSNENKEENNIEDIPKNKNENNENENENKTQKESQKENKRENALNTILYNVNENTKNLSEVKNDKLSNNNNIVSNKEEEQVNKSFEEEHIFDNKKRKEETDSVNYDFDDGDNIIDVDYEQI